MKRSGNANLLKLKCKTLQGSYYVCNEHFSDDDFSDIFRIKLRPERVPTEKLPQELSEELVDSLWLFPKSEWRHPAREKFVDVDSIAGTLLSIVLTFLVLSQVHRYFMIFFSK